MITVRAKLGNPDGKLLPGMYANVLVDAGTPETVITVPQTAVTFFALWRQCAGGGSSERA